MIGEPREPLSEGRLGTGEQDFHGVIGLALARRGHGSGIAIGDEEAAPGQPEQGGESEPQPPPWPHDQETITG